MKVLKELILNGEYIIGKPDDPSYVKYVLQYDGDNHGLKIIVQTNHNNRAKAAQQLAEIIEEETGHQFERTREIVLEKVLLKITQHGVNELIKNEELKDTIGLIQLTHALQRSTNALEKIHKELKMFLLNASLYSFLAQESPHFKYKISNKYHKIYQKRLMVVYCERLSDLIRNANIIAPYKIIGITTIDDPPSIIISAEAMSQLQSILNPPREFFPQMYALHDSFVRFASDINQLSQNNHATHAVLSSPAAPNPASRVTSPSYSSEPVTHKENEEIDINLKLLFRTGEYYFTIGSCRYIASYDYEPSAQNLSIVVNKENSSNTIQDNLTPRTANCQRIAENIYRNIRTQYQIFFGTEITFNRAEHKIDLSKQAVDVIFSDRNLEKSAVLIKLINILHKPVTMDCQKLLFEITCNKNKYIQCIPIGNSYNIICNYGNTTFEHDPGISKQMSLNLITRVHNLLNNLFKDKYPALYTNLDMSSEIWQKNPTGFTIKINKKACDDVLCDSYLQIAQINIPQDNIAFNDAKEILNSFIAPLKGRYLSTATITRMKDKLKNTVASLTAKINNLDELCQFYEFLKSEHVIKLLNAHKNPLYDSIFSKTNTNTWQEIIKVIRTHAFTLLRNKTEQLSDSPHKAELLSSYRNSPIFTDHRYNKFINRLHSTHTVREIDNLIASHRSPAIRVN